MTPQERFDRNTWLMKISATSFMAACLVLQLTALAESVVLQTGRRDGLLVGTMATSALLMLCLQLPTSSKT